jgi:small-conductance mechanosensitive channel
VGESEKETMVNKTLQLEKENKELERQIVELEEKIKRTEIVNAEERTLFKEDLEKEKVEYRNRIFKLQETISTAVERMMV